MPIEAAQTPLQASNISTLSLLKLSPVYRFSFTGEMSCSLHLNAFHFIAVMTLPHQNEKSKPFGQAYYLPPLPRVTTTLHPIRLSLGAALEGLFPKCLFLDSSLHLSSHGFVWEMIASFLCIFVFLSLLCPKKNISHSCFIPGLC